MIGFDTETQNGRAVLLTTPRAALVFPKSFGACARWLHEQADDSRAFVAWNLTYDARALLAFVPRLRLAQLWLGRAVVVDKVRVTWVHGKYLRLAIGRKAVTLYDAFPFYASSLDAAAEQWLGERKDEIPASWLSCMADKLKSARTRERVITYCKRDADLTQRLWEKCKSALESIGVNTARPVSPAALARRYYADSFKFEQPDGRAAAAYRRAYRGGRVEVVRRGHFPRAYYHDIRSAYPSELARLLHPDCLVSREGRTVSGNAVAGAYLCCVDIPITEHVGPLSVVREDGILFAPVGRFQCMLNLAEVRLFQRVPRFGLKVLKSWELVPGPVTRLMFPGLSALYELRKTSPEVNYAAKLLMNSLYGKLAERRRSYFPAKVLDVSSRSFAGNWFTRCELATSHTHDLLAGEVTAAVRVRLWEAVQAVGPANIVSVSTDSLFTLNRLPDSFIGDKLGDWSAADEGDLVQVSNGIYSFLPRDGVPMNRFRGFCAQEDVRALLEGRRAKAARMIVRRALGLYDYVHRRGQGAAAKLNAMLELTRLLDANGDTKRVWPVEVERASDLLKNQYESRPWIRLDKRGVSGHNKKERSTCRGEEEDRRRGS